MTKRLGGAEPAEGHGHPQAQEPDASRAAEALAATVPTPRNAPTVPTPQNAPTVPTPEHAPTVPTAQSEPTVALVPAPESDPTVALVSGPQSDPTVALVPVPAPTIPLVSPTETVEIPQRRQRPRRALRPRILIPTLVVAVLAAGGLVAYHFASGSPDATPAATVTSYFHDLENGDAAGATALAVGPYRANPKVGTQTLADAANRPGGLAVISTKPVDADDVQVLRTVGVTGRELTYVYVRYTVHGKAVDDTFLAQQDPKTSKWELVDPYEPLTVTGGWSGTVAVDGESFPESQQVEVFPGGHLVADPQARDFAPDGVTVYSGNLQQGANPAAALAPVTLPVPALSAAGQSAAQSAYAAALEQCASQAETGHGLCGLDNRYNGYTCRTVTWTITHAAPVVVDLTTENADGSFDVSATGSTAAETGDYTDWIGLDRGFQNQAADLEDSAGIIVFHADGSASVQLTA